MLNAYIFNILSIILFFVSLCNTELAVNKAELRPPKSNDIGLIFDLSIVNNAGHQKETLEFRIRGDKCCLVLSESETTCDVFKVVGGYFGQVEPGAIVIVSVIFPTITLYNRVGRCDITIISINSTDGRKQLCHQLEFDTTITPTKIPPIMKQFLIGHNISNCESIDLNPLDECHPVNCEEKYFGKRNFFNNTIKLCEQVPSCRGSTIIYDFYSNECVDPTHLITDEDIESIQNGQCDGNMLNLKRSIHYMPDINNGERDLYSSNGNSLDDTEMNSLKIKRSTKMSGVLNGFLVIMTTITIYVFVCFCLYLMVTWSSKKIATQKTKPPDLQSQSQSHSSSSSSSSSCCYRSSPTLKK